MNSFRRSVLSALSVLVISAAPAFADGDIKKGKKVFNKCKACHALKAGKKKVGPSLHGVIGRAAGSESYYKYSKAMKASGINWTEENLDKYLQAPKKFIPKNKMPFGGLKKQKDRANVIAYIRQAGQ